MPAQDEVSGIFRAIGYNLTMHLRITDMGSVSRFCPYILLNMN